MTVQTPSTDNQTISQSANGSGRLTQQDVGSGWKARTYIGGLLLGTTLGLLAAHLFIRAGEENETGQPEPPSTGTLIGITLSLITVLRQIAESGKQDKKDNKQRNRRNQ